MNASSVIAWEGPSTFDGALIRVVLTGIEDPSENPKTGPMLQTYVIPQGVHPVEAQRTGHDRSVCGACPARRSLEGWCYVTPLPLLAIARSIKDGRVPHLTYSEVEARVQGRPLRLGAYGDPAAVPFDFWAGLTRRASLWTGYTHAWRDCDPRFARILMASVEDPRSAREARAAGWRYFRAKPPGSSGLPGEILCPAQTHEVTCIECKRCGGTEGWGKSSVSIDTHGPFAAAFLQPRLL